MPLALQLHLVVLVVVVADVLVAQEVEFLVKAIPVVRATVQAAVVVAQAAPGRVPKAFTILNQAAAVVMVY
jgi:hypothetical protein